MPVSCTGHYLADITDRLPVSLEAISYHLRTGTLSLIAENCWYDVHHEKNCATNESWQWLPCWFCAGFQVLWVTLKGFILDWKTCASITRVPRLAWLNVLHAVSGYSSGADRDFSGSVVQCAACLTRGVPSVWLASCASSFPCPWVPLVCCVASSPGFGVYCAPSFPVPLRVVFRSWNSDCLLSSSSTCCRGFVCFLYDLQFSCCGIPSVEILFDLSTKQNAELCLTSCIKEPSVPVKQFRSPFKHRFLVDVLLAFLADIIFHRRY